MDCKTVAAACCILACALPADARIARSHAARVAFARDVACPSTGQYRLPCPGYVIDHVTPLACGGRDAPDNMQWQTVADGKAKDKWERRGCNVNNPLPR